MYVLLELSSLKIAKECGVYSTTIIRKLRKFNIRIRTFSEALSGKKNPNFGRIGKKHPMYKENNIRYSAIHNRAHKVDPKPVDGKCAMCHQVADKKDKTKLIHSNKDHSYRLPINPDEWWWIHESCHKEYDLPETKEKMKKAWTPERKKEQSDRIKELNKKNNPMKRPEVIEKAKKTREKNRNNKSEKIKKSKENKYKQGL